MTTEATLAWRAALRDDLRAAGPIALRMLAGEHAADPLVALPALQAAGLLDADTCGEDTLRQLRAELLAAAARHPEALARLTQEVDLSVDLLDAEDRLDALHRLVALGGLASALPPGRARTAVEDALAHEEAGLAVAQVDDDTLQAAASVIAGALDLEDDHPLSALLHLLSAPLVPPPERAFAAGLSRARAALFPSPVSQWFARARGTFADWLGGIALQPTLALGGAGDLAPVTPRTLVATTAAGDEVCVARVGDELAIEWMGDGPPPTDARIGGASLRELDPLVPGSRLWALGAPPDGPLTVSITLASGELLVDLDAA